MIKPNWGVFKAKFNENPQFNFEWLCYLLFCKEFNKPYGIFRYKNQSAIETNPIEVNGSEIGFQAKFYDVSLSSNKNDLITMLIKAKRDYPNIKTLRLYTNQEWGQAYPKMNALVKAQKPQAQKDIENKAQELEIELQWRTQSFFESSFVTEDSKKICKYFFLEENAALKFVEQQEKHTLNLLEQINNEIIFGDKKFTIERNGIFQQIKDNSHQVAIISGLGGVGKTVEIKRLYEEYKNKLPFFVFKATEFELNRLGDFSKDGDVYDFAECFGDSNKKIVVIDSAEKLLDLSNQEPAKEFIALALRNGWQIIFTTRDHYFDDLSFLCMEIYEINPLKIYISELECEELEALAKKHKFQLPADEKLMKLLRTPLYLNEYLKVSGTGESFDYLGFKNKLWNGNVKKGSVKREQAFLNFALKRANEGCFFLKPDIGKIDIAEDLVEDGAYSG